MRTKQVLLGCGALLLAALIVAAAIYLAPAKTVDFRGYVTEIYFDDTNDGSKMVAAIHCTDVFDNGSTYTVYAEYDIRVTDISGEKMTLDDIRPGDMIDLDYKHKTGKNGERYAKWITVCPQARPTN
ncbi:MAG: hypothetical protein IJW51_01645 [Clostridia bacterium]|nr:hypothetical protein [Clostridia bacterium]